VGDGSPCCLPLSTVHSCRSQLPYTRTGTARYRRHPGRVVQRAHGPPLHHSLRSPHSRQLSNAEEPFEMASMMDRSSGGLRLYCHVHSWGEEQIADAMSCYSFSIDSPVLIIAGISEVSVSTDFITQVKMRYTSDAKFCVQALKNVKSVPG
jgi:hypothetical protein